MPGAYIIAQATVRVTTANTGAPFPVSTAGGIKTPSLTVTAVNGNAGTVYIAGNRTSCNATVRERELIPLTGGQSFNFTGIPLGSSGYRDMTFGTGYSYVFASATTQRIVCTYLKQD